MSSSYYLRAIALTVLTFAAGLTIIGFSQGFVIGFASTSGSESATETVAILGGMAILFGSGVAVFGLVIASIHYRTGVQIQGIESQRSASSGKTDSVATSESSSPADRFIQQ